MRCRMRTAATRDGRLLAREVECWFDTGAYADNGPRVVATGGDAAPGPYRWAAVPGRRRLRLHEHRAGRLLPRLRGDAPAVDRASCRSTRSRAAPGSTRSRCGAGTCCTPGEEVRAGGKPLDADLVGDVEKVAEAVGWERERRAAGVGRGLSVGLLAAGAHPVSSAIVPPRGRRRRRRPRRHDRGRPGRAHRVRRRSPPRSSGCRPEQRHGARRRHALHALRPLDRREPLDHGRRPRRAARGRGGPRAARSRSPAPTTSSPTDLPGAHAPALRLRRRRADRPRRGAPRGHRLLRGGPGLLGGLRRRRRGRGRPGDRASCACAGRRPCADVGPRDQPAARRAPGRGRDAAGHRQRALRGDGLRGRPAAERHAARLPRADASRTCPTRCTASSSRTSDGPGPYGAKGCGEGALAAVTAAIATARRRRGRAR